MTEPKAPLDIGATPLVDDQNPWPGLQSYREQDQAYFKGREAQIAELNRMVHRERLTVLFGVSGLGKTSLLRAGLYPLLRQSDELPVHIRLAHGGDAPPPRLQVLTAVMQSALDAGGEAPAFDPSESLAECFHHRDADLWSARNRLVTPLLVFDQFEEVFSLGRGLDTTAAFLDELSDLVEGRPPVAFKVRVDRVPEEARRFDFGTHRYRILLSLREDFLPDLEGLRDRMPSCAHNRMWLRPMDGEAALRVVDQTDGRLIEADVACQVVRAVAGGDPDDARAALAALQVEPAILSLFCRELNGRRGSEPRISAELVRSARGEILERFYERSMAQVMAPTRAFVEEELLTGGGFRDNRAYADALEHPGVSERDLRLLIDARLLRLEERAGTRRIELTHDVLTKVACTSRDRRRELEQAAQEKQRLEGALRDAEERERQTRLEAEVRAVKEREQRLQLEVQAARKFKLLAGALAVVFVLAVLAAVAALWQAKQAQKNADRAKMEAAKASDLADLAKQKEAEAKKAADEEQVQRQLAEQRLQRITDGIQMKQAVLAGADAKIDAYLNSKLANQTIRFSASKEDVGYKTKDSMGNTRQVYEFTLFPLGSSVSGGLETIAAITFRVDPKAFRNPLLVTGKERDFRANYIGWGCPKRVVALIEYVDPARSPEIAMFKMCEALSSDIPQKGG